MPKIYGKDRIDFVTELDELFEGKTISLQNKLLQYLRDFFDEQFTTRDKIIVPGSRNIVRVNRIIEVQEQFREKEIQKLLVWMARRYVEVVNKNTGYFAAQMVVPRNIRRDVAKLILSERGLKVTQENKAVIEKGGWLYNLGNINDPYTAVQSLATDAAGNGMAMADFRKRLKNVVYGIDVPNQQTLLNHFRTNAFDGFAQVDRRLQKTYADKLELVAWIWEGGLIDTSREYPCRKLNGRILTDNHPEFLELDTRDWPGKNKNYNKDRDMGGHNCRHHKSYLSNELAIRLDPTIEPFLT